MFIRDQIWFSGYTNTEFANAATEHCGEAMADANYLDAIAAYCAF